ncbi:uncharacterized protein LOC112461981 [Temnothorax curvispinosus]|uniref:Uncharacterized protein LOC112461981 n=1 Tax=Temnothorax curvispinosus TaxID=300111 RepID=A0A6J1QMR3_9HYME|nr:uncharacterized protein LOC112461981 [Temnothorax curvispinosus]
MKEKKAAGTDGLANEVWIYGGERLREKIWEVSDKAWRTGEIAEDWKEGIIVPIVKKGEGKEAQDYRGVTLMNTSYKIYAAILAKRLEREVEEKGMLPETQTGFRKKKGTMENIYALNYVIGKAISKRKGKLVAAFIALKAAFDSVDRKKIWEVMKKEGISKKLRTRIEDLYEETRCVVRVKGEKGKCFWTVKGVRQGCPLSAMIFILLLADMEETMRKGQDGGVVVGKIKFWTLAYADDIVAVAEDEEEMKRMLKRLERYLDRKKLRVNVGKTKVMRFRKGGGKMKKVKWSWKEEEIEEVKEFCYLGYTFQKNGEQDAHINERVRKATIAMRQVWGIGKRLFGGDWIRRIKLYDALVASIALYGAEIWGWKEREKIERMHERYIRWTLGLDWSTPGYMIREETKRDKERISAGRRAMKYEEKLERGEGNEIARECWREIREMDRKKKSKWEEERKSFYERRGYAVKEIERKRGEGWSSIEELTERDRDIQIQEKDERIRESRYNKWYKEVIESRRPEYLERKGKEQSMIRIARFRLGNEMRSGRYWDTIEKTSCRICGAEAESWEHVLEWCARDKEREEKEGISERIKRILDSKGEGEKWMAELERKRRQASQ